MIPGKSFWKSLPIDKVNLFGSSTNSTQVSSKKNEVAVAYIWDISFHRHRLLRYMYFRSLCHCWFANCEDATLFTCNHTSSERSWVGHTKQTRSTSIPLYSGMKLFMILVQDRERNGQSDFMQANSPWPKDLTRSGFFSGRRSIYLKRTGTQRQ